MRRTTCFLLMVLTALAVYALIPRSSHDAIPSKLDVVAKPPVNNRMVASATTAKATVRLPINHPVAVNEDGVRIRTKLNLKFAD